MNIICQEKLKQLIEPHFNNDLKKDNYEIKTIKASKLLRNTRLDIAFKLLYLEMLDKNVRFAQEIYQEHIRAFSLGKFTEPGNEEKNSIDKFMEDFDKIFEDIKNNGFNSSKTLIPLSKNGSIANGSHRVASAIILDKYVDCVMLDIIEHIYDYKFFYKRNISSDILDSVVIKFVEYANNVHIACIWPTAVGNDDKIEKLIPNIIYKKKIKLSPNGAFNFLSKIYYDEEWIGDIKNNFKGVDGKLVECFKSFDAFEVIAFQSNSLNEVLKIKDKIRKIFNVGNHSVHITDTKEEAVSLARIIFNKNSIHFLNYAKPNKYISTYQKINKLNKFIKINKLDKNNFLLDSSIILSAYGLREAKDSDYFYSDSDKIKVELYNINSHNDELKYHEENKNNMIHNQKFYFYFNDLKFISYSQLYKMKKNRAEEKDINDCKMMEALIEGNKLKIDYNRYKQNIFYLKIKINAVLRDIFKSIRIYSFVRTLYHFIKGKI